MIGIQGDAKKNLKNILVKKKREKQTTSVAHNYDIIEIKMMT
jgi:hypothetical protein